MQLMMRRPEIIGFVSVSPPASIYDFSFLAPCPASGMIVHGDQDQIVPVATVDKLAQKLGSQKNITIDYRIIQGADHFFTNKIEHLEAQVSDYLVQARKAA
jgi:alpha/beta superfamily hydrolase